VSLANRVAVWQRGRVPRIGLLGVLVLVLTGLAAAPASAGGPLVIHGDTSIAGFGVRSDGSLGGAVAALGQPTSTVRSGNVCTVRWRGLGIRMVFYNLGGDNPCSAQGGRFSYALATGSRWQTNRGLRIGDTRARLRQLYPGATYRRSGFFSRGWWLVTRSSPVGAGGRYAGLLARMHQGRVAAFLVRYPAGGD
jgi:hypothetical protein